MERHPTLILVTGLPGTGKSTVATATARVLGTAVIAHDWAMSGLRPYPTIQAALDGIPSGHRVVGWSLLIALARAQLEENRSIVLDGVARSPQVKQCRAIAAEVGAQFLLIATECSDRLVHRSRIEGRERLIPGWYELQWEDVERALVAWEPMDSDLSLDALRPWAANEAELNSFLEVR